MKTDNLDVLIVDDEPDICYLLSRILQKRNLNTSSVNSLGEAKREMNSKKPDILFLDNHLPDGLGSDFILNVKESNPLTKIVMITAHDTKDDRSKAFNKGADYFIGKPFTTKSVMQTVDYLLKAI